MAIGTAAALLGIGSALAPIIGGAIGNAASQGDRDKQRQLMEKALANIAGIPLPDIQAMQLDYDSPELQGILQPEMIKLVKADPSLMQDIKVDPRLRDAQMSALSKLQEVGASGFRPEDEAMLNRIKSEVAQDANAKDQAILQNMQQRGIGGAGAELASRLGSSQSAANRESQQGLDIAGQASQRALDAILKSGSFGQSMEQTQFDQEARKATAQDVINKWNTANAQDVGAKNTGITNDAAAANLAMQQKIADLKVQIANQQQAYNKNLPQVKFTNALQQAIAASGQTKNLSDLAGTNATQTQATGAGVGQGVGQAFAGFGQAAQNQDLLDILKKNKAQG